MIIRSLQWRTGCCSRSVLTATGATAETKLKFGHYNAESHPVHKAALQFKQNVEKRTNGEIKIEIYPNNVLGSPA